MPTGYIETTILLDEVITEVRAIKRAISERHGNDIERLIATLMAQESSSHGESENADPNKKPHHP